MATVYDIARQAGVSTATVSRVVHGSDLVRPETRQRVTEIIERLGFVPDASAQGLSTRRKDIIGLVALERGADEIDIERSSLLYVDEIVHAVEGVLRGSEVSLLLSFGPRGASFQRRIRTLSGKVDGLLMAEDVLPRSELAALARRVPVVLIAGPADSPDARQRLAAFEEVVRTTSRCTTDRPIHGDFSEASGSDAGRALLARPRLPEAVACANDQMAIGLLREFRRAGVAVPGDVAVTGFDDIYPSRMTDPPLTTVSQPLRDLGSMAARRLLDRVERGERGARPPTAEVLPTHLVIRGSCGCPAPGEG